MTNKQIVYIGNNLSGKGYTVTTMDTLGSLLSIEDYEVIKSSSHTNRLLRILDMIFTTIYYSRKTDYVIIDTYSTLNFWYAFLVSQICRLLKLKYIRSKILMCAIPVRLCFYIDYYLRVF